MSKYRNQPCDYDGHHFDSKAERDRYIELVLLQNMGVIKGLECQKKFVLQSKGKYPRSGKPFSEISYIADFAYTIADTGEKIVEDVKGYRTREFIMKKKMMAKVYYIEIQEVKA